MLKVGTTNESTRVKWIEETLRKIPEGHTLLDAGAGESQFKKYCSHLQYIAQDFGQYEGKGDAGLHTGTWDNSKLDIISDIVDIPLQDKSIDAIMCTEVLEHVPNPIQVLHEFKRLLKPGGYLLITVPFVSFTHFAPYHFATGLSRFFFEHHLSELDFAIDNIELNGNYFEFLAQENRRIKSVAKKYAGKNLTFIEKIIIHLNLAVLQRLSKKDINSSELLCYGIHVFARKN